MEHVRSSVQLKKYRVACWRTHYGFYDVEAKNEKEAEAKAPQNLWNGQDLDLWTNTDAGITETEEL
jgi:hypothetical protein